MDLTRMTERDVASHNKTVARQRWPFRGLVTFTWALALWNLDAGPMQAGREVMPWWSVIALSAGIFLILGTIPFFGGTRLLGRSATARTRTITVDVFPETADEA